MTMVDARATSAGVAAAVAPGGDELVDGGAAAVVNDEPVPRGDEVLRHRLAHDA